MYSDVWYFGELSDNMMYLRGKKPQKTQTKAKQKIPQNKQTQRNKTTTTKQQQQQPVRKEGKENYLSLYPKIN